MQDISVIPLTPVPVHVHVADLNLPTLGITSLPSFIKARINKRIRMARRSYLFGREWSSEAIRKPNGEQYKHL